MSCYLQQSPGGRTGTERDHKPRSSRFLVLGAPFRLVDRFAQLAPIIDGGLKNGRGVPIAQRTLYNRNLDLYCSRPPDLAAAADPQPFVNESISTVRTTFHESTEEERTNCRGTTRERERERSGSEGREGYIARRRKKRKKPETVISCWLRHAGLLLVA